MRCTGEKVKPLSREKKFDWRAFVLYADKLTLYERIERRCEAIVEMGLFDEVMDLYAQGLLRESASSVRRSIGYKETLDFLQQNPVSFVRSIGLNLFTYSLPQYPITVDQFLHFMNTFKTASRNYANYQYKWFRSQKEFQWIDVTDFVALVNQQENDAQCDAIMEKWAEYVSNSYFLSSNEYQAETEETIRLKQRSMTPQHSSRVEKANYLMSLGKLYIYQDEQLLFQRVEKINQKLEELRLFKE